MLEELHEAQAAATMLLQRVKYLQLLECGCYHAAAIYQAMLIAETLLTSGPVAETASCDRPRSRIDNQCGYYMKSADANVGQ